MVSYNVKQMLQLYIVILSRQTDDLRRQPLHDVTESAVNQDLHVSPSSSNIVLQSPIFYGHRRQIPRAVRNKQPVCAEQPDIVKPNKCTHPIIAGLVAQQSPANTKLENVTRPASTELETRQQPASADQPPPVNGSAELENSTLPASAKPDNSVQPTDVTPPENQQSCDIESQLPELNSSCLSEILSEAHRELFPNDILDDCIDTLANSSLFGACDLDDYIGEESGLVNCEQLLPMQYSPVSASDSQTPVAHVEMAARTEKNVRQKIVLVLTRKRRRSKDTWKCSIRKINRQAGLEYVATTGKTVSARCGTPKTIKDCLHKCKFKCAEKISESVRQQIHTDFWQQSDDGKACFYAQTVTRHKKRRHRNKSEDVSVDIIRMSTGCIGENS